MAVVRFLHEVIVENGAKVYLPGTELPDLSKALIDELLPIGAIEVLSPSAESKAVEAKIKQEEAKK